MWGGVTTDLVRKRDRRRVVAGCAAGRGGAECLSVCLGHDGAEMMLKIYVPRC